MFPLVNYLWSVLSGAITLFLSSMSVLRRHIHELTETAGLESQHPEMNSGLGHISLRALVFAFPAAFVERRSLDLWTGMLMTCRCR